MALRGFEDRLERMVEGVFARAFKSGLQPVEIGRKLTKEMDANKSIDVRGRSIAPNEFDIHISSSDFERFSNIQDSLSRELASTVREHAQVEDLLFLGRVGVALEADPEIGVGLVRVTSAFNESLEATSPIFLEFADGSQVALGRDKATIGRLADSSIVLSDPNASRLHAELHPEGDSYALVDLGSTNGSRVNGVKVEHQLLRDGDELTFGTVTLKFRLL